MSERCTDCGMEIDYRAIRASASVAPTQVPFNAGTDTPHGEVACLERRYTSAVFEIEGLRSGPEWSAFEHELKRRVAEMREAIKLEYADMVCLAKTRRDEEWAKAEKLQAVVDKLPKTADGVPVTNKMSVWAVWDCGNPFELVYHAPGPWLVHPNCMSSLPLSDCYSTRAAAEAAKAEEEKK